MTITEDKFTLKYARFVIRWRVPILVLLLIATALLATQIPKLDVRNDPDTLLPGVNRYVATNLYAEEKFGMGNLMVFAVKIKEGDIFQPWFINIIQAIHNRLVVSTGISTLSTRWPSASSITHLRVPSTEGHSSTRRGGRISVVSCSWVLSRRDRSVMASKSTTPCL